MGRRPKVDPTEGNVVIPLVECETADKRFRVLYADGDVVDFIAPSCDVAHDEARRRGGSLSYDLREVES